MRPRILAQQLLPTQFNGSEDRLVERLQQMSEVGRQSENDYIVFLGLFDQGKSQVGSMAIANKYSWSVSKVFSFLQKYLLKPIMELGTLHPPLFACCEAGPLWSTLGPIVIQVLSLPS